jgi:uncharacterized membrane protein YgdD (TMEM256/DUF423 family)
MYHALALVLVGILRHWGHGRYLVWSGTLFAVGIVVFSGSLYALAATGAGWWGAVTPVGGLCLLGGWASLALGARTDQTPLPSGAPRARDRSDG